MGGGNGGNQANNQDSFFEDDGDKDIDAVAMLGVLASIKEGAGSAWEAYNDQLAEKPILVKVRESKHDTNTHAFPE